jgi:hypothetical protein
MYPQHENKKDLNVRHENMKLLQDITAAMIFFFFWIRLQKHRQ